MHPVNRSVNWSHSVDDHPEEEAVMQISGAGHWFLEGWIRDHTGDFLVDSGSLVTAVSSSFYKNLRGAGVLVGKIWPMNRMLRGANGSQIDIHGCSFCVVSFLGLQTEFPTLVCDLSTDDIIGTDILGSMLPHTLDIKHGLLFTEVPSTTPQGCCIIRTGVHRGTLLYSTVFRARSSLYHSYCGWPVDAAKRTAGMFDHFLGEYWPGSGPDTG